MNRVGYFEKVSFEQFFKDIKDEFNNKWSDEEIRAFYDDIKLPKRATKGSAGYDFYSPIPFALHHWNDIKIPTGIRVRIADGWFLSCMPRSGMGFKHYLRLANTLGVIDNDYYFSSNEGHIWLKIRAENNQGKPFVVARGDGVMQGVFLPFGIADNDNPRGKRVGGFGSTSAQ